MSNAQKIAVLEDLLSRVQRNAGAARPKRDEPRILRPEVKTPDAVAAKPPPILETPKPAPAKAPEAAKAPEPKTPEAAKPPAPALDLEPLPPRPDLSAPRAPMGTLAGIGPELSPEPPPPPQDEPPPSAAALASSRPPPSVVIVGDDAPIAVDAGGDGDEEVLDDGDEVEVLSEEDVVAPSSGGAMLGDDDVVPSSRSLGDGDVLQSAEIIEGGQDELIPVEDEPAPRPRTVPPPLPVQEARRSVPPPLPLAAAAPKIEDAESAKSSDDLEADVVLPKPRGPMPTTEQLGNTLDLEEGPEARLELAATPVPKIDLPSEEEAELPLAQSPGEYKVESLPAPEPPSREVLDEHAPIRDGVAALGGLPTPIVHLDVPASPPPAPLPVVAAAPAPVRVDLSPVAVARPTAAAQVPTIVAAAKKAAPATWADLVAASMKLG